LHWIFSSDDNLIVYHIKKPGPRFRFIYADTALLQNVGYQPQITQMIIQIKRPDIADRPYFLV